MVWAITNCRLEAVFFSRAANKVLQHDIERATANIEESLRALRRYVSPPYLNGYKRQDFRDTVESQRVIRKRLAGLEEQ